MAHIFCCFACLVNFVCHLLWILLTGCWIFLCPVCLSIVMRYSYLENNLVLSGFAFFRQDQKFSGYLFSPLRQDSSVYSSQFPMNLVWLVGGNLWAQGTLIFSGHSFLSLWAVPYTHTLDLTQAHLTGASEDLQVLLSPIDTCSVNCSHLGLPKYFALPQTLTNLLCLGFLLALTPRTLSRQCWAVIWLISCFISLQSLPSLPDVLTKLF